MRRCLAFAAAALFALLPTQATAAGPAEDPQTPAGTLSADPASSGTTELDGQGSFGTAVQQDDEAGDTLEWGLSFGALLSTGNARSTAITGGTTFLVRRDRHQFFGTFLGNYGRAAASRDAEPVDTVGNLQGRARYDFFFAKRWSAFGMVTARHDPFQLLDLRLNIDPGVAYYLINRSKEQLRFEAGYDFQYDNPSDAAVERNQDGSIDYTVGGGFKQLPPRNVHAIRLASGYRNNLNDAVTFATELEYLQSVQRAQRWRLNWNTDLSTLLVSKLSIAASFTLRMDNDPYEGAKNVDTITSINLVYRFL